MIPNPSLVQISTNLVQRVKWDDNDGEGDDFVDVHLRQKKMKKSVISLEWMEVITISNSFSVHL